MKHFAAVALAFAPACLFADTPPGPPPLPTPFVGEIRPDTGAYGSEVTILGTGFGTSGSVAFAGVTSDFGQIITSWTDTEIHVRVPFPAGAGPFTITTPGGSTETPMFTPTTTWAVGASAAAPITVFEARGFGTAFAAITLDAQRKTALLVLDGTSANSYVLDGVAGSTDARQPVRARLVTDDTGAVAVLATDSNSALQLFTISATALVVHPGGVGGTLVAAGRDATGLYAWLQIVDSTSSQPVFEVERVRPGATIDAPWHVDRGPLGSIKVLDAAVATDGTLVVAYSEFDGNIFDNMATLGIRHLAPAAGSFAAAEYPDNLPYDDYIASAHITLAGDGQRMIVDWSTQEYDEPSDHPHAPFTRQPAGTWVHDSTSNGAFTYTQASIATAQVGPDGVVVTADITNAGEAIVPVWPARPIALVSDGTGTLRPLISAENKVWFPAPPAQ